MNTILEYCICRLPNFLPYLILALLPFRDSFRFSFRTTIGMSLVLSLIDCGGTVLGQISEERNLLTLFKVLLYIIFFLFCVHANAYKILFALFMILNYAAMVTIVSIFFCYRLYHITPGISRFPYVWILILVLALSFPFMCQYINKNVRNLVISEEAEIEKAWRTLWLIPATFYVIYYYSFYANWSNSSSISIFSTKPGNVLFVLLLNAASFLMYRTVQKLLKESISNLRLQAENSQFSLLIKQYETLKTNIGETRKVRHDMRHHFLVIENFLAKNEMNSLHSYLSEYKESISDIDYTQLCDNPVVNAVAGCYRSLARQAETESFFSLQLPEQLPLPDSDFCTLLSNLLENALEACERMAEKPRFLKVTARMDGHHMLILVVENSFEHPITEKNGVFLSSKRKGSGIGIVSVRSIVKKYNGLLKMEYENGVFCANVFLNP